MYLVGRNASISFKFGKTGKFLGNHPFAKVKLEIVCSGAEENKSSIIELMLNNSVLTGFQRAQVAPMSKGVSTISVCGKIRDE